MRPLPLLLMLVCGCGGAAANGDAPVAGNDPAPSSSSSAVPEETPRTDSEGSKGSEPDKPATEPATASTGSSADKPAASSAPSPKGRSPKETQRMMRRCAPMVRKLQAAGMKKGAPRDPRKLLDQVKNQPMDLPRHLRAECVTFLEGQTTGYVNAIAVEGAKTHLMMFGKLMASAYERDGKLCPSTPHPAPRDLQAPAGKDWDNATWRCLGMDLGGRKRTFFQYSVESGSDAFTIRATSAPTSSGKPMVLSLKGSVVSKRITLGKVQ